MDDALAARRVAARQEIDESVVVARLTRDVTAGEELCNAYIDVDLSLKKRRRELNEYGFVCGCAKCAREQAAKTAKDQAKGTAAGKKRLK